MLPHLTDQPDGGIIKQESQKVLHEDPQTEAWLTSSARTFQYSVMGGI
jgi:hypothetical protein